MLSFRTHGRTPLALLSLLLTKVQRTDYLTPQNRSPPPKLAIKLINSLLQQNALYQPWKPLEELLRACKFRRIRKRKQSPFKFILKLGIFQKLWAVLASGDCRKEPNDSEEAITAAQRGSTMGISTGIVMTSSSGTEKIRPSWIYSNKEKHPKVRSAGKKKRQNLPIKLCDPQYLTQVWVRRTPLW